MFPPDNSDMLQVSTVTDAAVFTYSNSGFYICIFRITQLAKQQRVSYVHMLHHLNIAFLIVIWLNG